MDYLRIGQGVEDPRFWQLNPEWSDLPLGTSGTIGQYGCAVCASARMLWAVRGYSRDTYWSPLQLNKWLAEHNGYAKGNLIVWAAVDALGLVQFKAMIEHPRPISDEALTELIAWVKSGNHVLLEVDYDPRYKAGKQPHWLHADRVIDDPLCDDPRLMVYDPWFGKIIDVGAGRYVRYFKSVRNAIWREIRYEVVEQPEETP